MFTYEDENDMEMRKLSFFSTLLWSSHYCMLKSTLSDDIRKVYFLLWHLLNYSRTNLHPYQRFSNTDMKRYYVKLCSVARHFFELLSLPFKKSSLRPVIIKTHYAFPSSRIINIFFNNLIMT